MTNLIAKLKPLTSTLIAASVCAGGSVDAALIDRGNGLIYDTTLDVTWLSDANYAETDLSKPGRVDGLIGTVVNGRAVGKYDFIDDAGNTFQGRMLWWGAMAWVQTLDYLGITGWRLPTTAQPDSSCDLQFNAATTGGYPPVPASGGHNCRGSELGYMFYENLGASAYQNIFAGSNSSNLALFSNLAVFPNAFNPNAYEYWSSTLDASYHDPGDNTQTSAWYFDVGDGWQGFGSGGSYMHAWAVHDGDVGRPVSEPGTVVLLVVGLLAGHYSRNKKPGRLVTESW